MTPASRCRILSATIGITGDIATRCLPGYVWRAASASDRVCVTPETRDRTREENAASPARTLANGYCVDGYVWREAFAGDRACVTPASRATAAADNAASPARTNP